MIGRRCTLFALSILLILVLSVNIYFIRMIVESSSSHRTYAKNLPEPKPRQDPSTSSRSSEKDLPQLRSIAKDIGERLKEEIRTLPSKYFKQNTSYTLVLERLLAELTIMPNVREDIWNIPNNNWPDAHQLIPPAAPELGTILEVLRRSRVVRADNAPLGTQLKLMLNLENDVKALFKPQWYSRHAIIHGPVYHGKDRHNAEVVAFYLSSLLALRRVPLAVMRKLDLKEEVGNCATPALYATMYQEGNDTCLYGVCHYCSPSDPVCGTGDVLEGALIFWLPRYLRLVKHRHPWQRTYKRNKLAAWEIDEGYCDKVKDSKAYSPQSSSRLLDLIDTAIFDFLMDNGDRHHYELAQNNFHNPAVLLIDNGKSLSNPDVDHLDILAPLYQCCMIHKTMWDRLRLFSGGSLSIALGRLLVHEAEMSNVSPLITEAHLSAMNRRLLTIYVVVENCLKKKKYISNIMKFGFPGLDHVRSYEDFVLSYDRRNRVAHWVFEHLTKEKVAVQQGSGSNSNPLYLPKRETDGKKYVRYEVIGANHVAVPTHFYKVIVGETNDGKLEMEAFVMPDTPIDDNAPLTNFQVPPDSIERAAGLLFFDKISRNKLSKVNGKNTG